MCDSARVTFAYLQVSSASADIAKGTCTAPAVLDLCNKLQVRLESAPGQHFADILATLLILQPKDIRTRAAAAILGHVQTDGVTVNLTSYLDALRQGKCLVGFAWAVTLSDMQHLHSQRLGSWPVHCLCHLQ